MGVGLERAGQEELMQVTRLLVSASSVVLETLCNSRSESCPEDVSGLCLPCRACQGEYSLGNGLKTQEEEGWGRKLICGDPGSQESVNLVFPHHFLQALFNQASQNQGHAMPSGTVVPNIVSPIAPREETSWCSHQVTLSHTYIAALQPSHSCRLDSHIMNPVHAGQPHTTPTHRSTGGGHGFCQEWNGPESPL